MFRKKKPEESPDPDTTNTAAPRQLPELKQLRFSRASLRYQILESLSLQLDSGVQPITVIEEIANEAEEKRIKKALLRSSDAIKNGQTITTALQRSGLFDPFTLSVVAAGERSGGLADNIRLASDQAKRNVSFRNHLMSAMLYPGIVLLVALMVSIGVSVFVLPRISDVFDGLDVSLPLLTRGLLAMGAFFKDNALLVVVGTALLVFGAVMLVASSKRVRGGLFIIVSHLPGFRTLLLQIEVTRFGFVAGSLLGAGIPITIMLELLEHSVTDKRYKKMYAVIRRQVTEGKPLGKAFAEYPRSKKLIPSNVQQIVRAGEKSGRLSDTLQKVGKVYESKLDVTTQNITTIIEPLLLFAVAIMVAVLAIAIIVPIYNLVGSVG